MWEKEFYSLQLTFLVVIPSVIVTQDGDDVQKMVIANLTRSMNAETDVRRGLIVAVGSRLLNWPFTVEYNYPRSVSALPPRSVDTISCSNRCMLTLYYLIAHLNAIRWRPMMRYKGTGKYKYNYNSYFYCAPFSLTDGALQKSANTCFTAVEIKMRR